MKARVINIREHGGLTLMHIVEWPAQSWWRRLLRQAPEETASVWMSPTGNVWYSSNGYIMADPERTKRLQDLHAREQLKKRNFGPRGRRRP